MLRGGICARQVPPLFFVFEQHAVSLIARSRFSPSEKPFLFFPWAGSFFFLGREQIFSGHGVTGVTGVTVIFVLKKLTQNFIYIYNIYIIYIDKQQAEVCRRKKDCHGCNGCNAQKKIAINLVICPIYTIFAGNIETTYDESDLRTIGAAGG